MQSHPLPECLYPWKVHILDLNPRGEAFRRKLIHEGGVFTNMINALINKSVENSFYPFHLKWGHIEKKVSMNQEAGLIRHWMCWHFGLGFPRELWELNICCLPYPVYNILLKQPKLRKKRKFPLLLKALLTLATQVVGNWESPETGCQWWQPTHWGSHSIWPKASNDSRVHTTSMWQRMEANLWWLVPSHSLLTERKYQVLA